MVSSQITTHNHHPAKDCLMINEESNRNIVYNVILNQQVHEKAPLCVYILLKGTSFEIDQLLGDQMQMYL